MVAVEAKANCVLWLAELKSVIAVKRRFAAHYRKAVLHRAQLTIGSKDLKKLGPWMKNDDPRGLESARKL